jgi:hypothetical protein
MQHIDFISFGTFGSPKGFNQKSDKNLTYKTFDLNPNAIKIFPNSNLFSLRKDNTNGNNLIAYSIYTYARERNSDRSGTFIGSSFVFYKEISTEEQILRGIIDYHQKLIQNAENVKENVIQVGSSNELKRLPPINIKELNTNLRKVENINFQACNKDFAIYFDDRGNNLVEFLKGSLELLNEYDTIFFTKDVNIVKYIQEKKLIEITDRDGFYNKIELYRKKKEEEIRQKFKQGIDHLERTKIYINSEYSKLNQDLDSNINNYRKVAQDNEGILHSNQKRLRKSEEEKKETERSTKSLLENINSIINDLKNHKIDPEKIISKNNIFREEFELIKSRISPYYVERVKPIHIPQNDRNPHNFDKTKNKKNEIEKPQKNENVWVIILIISLLFISIIINGLLYNEKSELETKIENINNSIEENNNIQTNESEKSSENEDSNSGNQWNEPNSILNSNDLKRVNNKFSKNVSIKIDSVVKIIFKLNPTDINEHFKNFQPQYQELLLNKNPNSFFKSGNDIFWTQELKEIPRYIKP